MRLNFDFALKINAQDELLRRFAQGDSGRGSGRKITCFRGMRLGSPTSHVIPPLKAKTGLSGRIPVIAGIGKQETLTTDLHRGEVGNKERGWVIAEIEKPRALP